VLSRARLAKPQLKRDTAGKCLLPGLFDSEPTAFFQDQLSELSRWFLMALKKEVLANVHRTKGRS
jgi:hypothetical protein